MAGLLEKDVRLIMQRKQILLLFVVIAVVLGFSQDGTFILGYLSFCASIVMVSTISYDELDHGYEFLMTLPITAKIYVKEKYLFCIGGAVIAWLFAAILYFVSKMIRGETFSFLDELPVALISLPIILLMLSILIPFQLKYGMEKSRIILALLAGIIAAAIYFIKNLIDGNSKILTAINSVNDEVVTIILFALGIFATLISYFISSRIMEKKEF